MAFVLVQHLDPKHESALTAILAKSTSMPVSEVKDATKIEPNHVYIIPPNKDLSLANGILKLSPRSLTRGQHLPVNHFFTVLAQVMGEDAIGVILSGSGSDGAVGIQAIKNEGGITFAQNTESAAYEQMPSSAIATTCVDFVLTPAEIGKELSRIAQHPYLKKRKDNPVANFIENPELNDFEKVLALLRRRTKVDFTHYKETTIRRRVLRRMIVHKFDSMSAYASFLNENTIEIDALYNDLLINVTEFFRDEEVFQALKDKVFPTVLKGRKGEPVRIWVPGCSTGEEVYSIAIVILECLDKKLPSATVQIFATDISERAIQKARLGIYPTSSLGNISTERIRRFFIKGDNGYQISKSIRDICVFATQNVTADPPFSKIDLISCRNLLIYLGLPLQKRVVPIFHYALKNSGFLLLGSSETIGPFADLFRPVDKKNKIYSKKIMSAATHFNFSVGRYTKVHPLAAAAKPTTPATAEVDVQREVERFLFNNSVGVVVNEKLEIVHTIGDVGPYLTLSQGTPSLNVTRMARETLSVDLRGLIQKAKKEGIHVKSEPLRIEYNGGQKGFFIETVPLKHSQSGQNLLVLFKEIFFHSQTPPLNERKRHIKMTDAELHSTNNDLQRELVATKKAVESLKENLQSSLEAQEAANEELKSANEEILSSNEELQSTNEELETSKEELQSSNEELTTVNEELQNRNAELHFTNNDLVNLLSSVKIPVVMLGSDCKIRRFTPLAEKILNIIPTDIGRPITDITLNVTIPNLKEALSNVRETVAPQEFEVQDQRGHWYSFRIHPYRTTDNRIDGAVLVLIDIHGIKTSRDFAQSIVETVREPLLVLSKDLKVITANQSFYDTYKVTKLETENHLIYDLGNKQWDIPKLRKLLAEILPKENVFNDFEVKHRFEHIGERTMLLNARCIRLESEGADEMILLAIEDITNRKHHEEALKVESDNLAQTNVDLERFAYIASHDLQEPLRMISLYMGLLASQCASKLSKEEGGYIQMASDAAHRMKALVEDLLSFSGSSQEDLGFEQTNCSELVDRITTELKVTIAENRAEVRHDSLPTIPANGRLLGQVFQNLIANAIKFHGPTPPKIWISAKQNDSAWEFSIKDNGIGIKREYANKIFDIFQRLHSREEYPGTGIGLAMCKRIVERYGGRIWVESDLKKGSTFYFTIPIGKSGS